MHRVGVAQWVLDRRGEAAVARAAELGFEVVHVDFGLLDDPEGLASGAARRRLARLASDRGVAIGAVALNAVEKYGLTRPADEHGARLSRDVIRAGVEAAVELGAPMVYLPSFHASEMRSRDDLRTTAAALREACELAEGTSLEVASENTLGADANRALVDAVAHPRLRILLDCFNPSLWGHRAGEIARALRDRLAGQVHVKDGRGGVMGNARLGEGEGRFDETADALVEIGFAGDLILENDYGEDALARSAADRAVLARRFTARA